MAWGSDVGGPENWKSEATPTERPLPRFGRAAPGVVLTRFLVALAKDYVLESEHDGDGEGMAAGT